MWAVVLPGLVLLVLTLLMLWICSPKTKAFGGFLHEKEPYLRMPMHCSVQLIGQKSVITLRYWPSEETERRKLPVPEFVPHPQESSSIVEDGMMVFLSELTDPVDEGFLQKHLLIVTIGEKAFPLAVRVKWDGVCMEVALQGEHECGLKWQVLEEGWVQ